MHGLMNGIVVKTLIAASLVGCVPAETVDDNNGELPDGMVTMDNGLYAVTMEHVVSPVVSGDVEMDIHVIDVATLEDVTDATLTLTPWHASMDHGVSEDPSIVDRGDGGYLASWNYPVDGEWDLTLEVDGALGSDELVVSFDVEDGELEDGETPVDDLTLIDSVESGDLTLQIYAPVELSVGLNHLTYAITQTASGDVVGDLTLVQTPLMNMAEADNHSCPNTSPVALDQDGFYQSDIVFVMPSGMMGSWSHTVTATDGDDVETVFEFASLDVVDAPTKKMIQVGDPAVPWVLTLNFEDELTTGDNRYTLTAHKKESAMSWPALDDLGFEVTPFMPAMGHGSTGSIDPTLDGDGFYSGIVVFSMMGAWEVTADIVQGSDDITSLTWEVEI